MRFQHVSMVFNIDMKKLEKVVLKRTIHGSIELNVIKMLMTPCFSFSPKSGETLNMSIDVIMSLMANELKHSPNKTEALLFNN